MPSSPAALIGTAVHAGSAAYDVARKAGTPITLNDAASVARDAVEHPAEEVDWRNDAHTPKGATDLAGTLTGAYVAQLADTMTFVSIEEQLPAATLRVQDVNITLTGHVDRIRIDESGTVGIIDVKTGKKINAATHRAQLGVYRTLATLAKPELSINGADEIIAISTSQGTVERIQLPGNAMDLLVGSEGKSGLLHHVATIVKGEAFYGNPRSQLCSEKYCPRHGVCSYR